MSGPKARPPLTDSLRDSFPTKNCARKKGKWKTKTIDICYSTLYILLCPYSMGFRYE
jgi:hypothetical protein